MANDVKARTHPSAEGEQGMNREVRGRRLIPDDTLDALQFLLNRRLEMPLWSCALKARGGQFEFHRKKFKREGKGFVPMLRSGASGTAFPSRAWEREIGHGWERRRPRLQNTGDAIKA
jgi:hypothetical protein